MNKDMAAHARQAAALEVWCYGFSSYEDFVKARIARWEAMSYFSRTSVRFYFPSYFGRKAGRQVFLLLLRASFGPA
jgi:hypothetical protein